MIIAMALISIVSIMIVSFSAMTHSFAGDEQSKHSFIDECAEIRRDISDFLLEQDKADNEMTLYEDSGLNGEGGTLYWHNHPKELGGKVYENIDDISFEIGSSKLLKCTVTGSTEKGVEYKQTFVFALRCATFVEG
jgi:hypothetical protein